MSALRPGPTQHAFIPLKMPGMFETEPWWLLFPRSFWNGNFYLQLYC